MQTRETHPVSASMENDHHKTLGLDLVFLERPHMSTSPILHFWEKSEMVPSRSQTEISECL